jgi:hypothetical protein
MIAVGVIAAVGGVAALSSYALADPDGPSFAGRSDRSASAATDPTEAGSGEPSTSGAGGPTSSGSSGPASSSPAGATPGAAPTTPKAKTCGSRAMAGPAQAPAGAVVVSPTQDLGNLVEGRGARTTYWLAPGTHKLGDGPYDQVIPHAGDTFIGAPGAVLDGPHRALYALTRHAPGVTI